MSKDLYIGLISGTSMDAVDAVLIEINAGRPRAIAQQATPLPSALKESLLQLCSNHDIDLRLLGRTDIAVAALFAESAQTLIQDQGLNTRDIAAIGSHGQTIWHEPPDGGDNTAFTLQIGDPNTIAERTGITTVADFRRRDMAAGGQGAPLVPVLHQALFQSAKTDRVVLNLGGIANITLLFRDGRTPLGLDTGPASVLMDGWISRHQALPFDDHGAWASSGEVHEALLHALLEEQYFRSTAPKSTGRELFNLAWLERKLQVAGGTIEPAIVQATLLALTVESVASEIERHVTRGEILVCGGGARNTALLQQLRARLSSFTVESTSAYGLDADYVEATAFGWFAWCTLHRQPIAFHPFTGARHPVIAGGVYFA